MSIRHKGTVVPVYTTKNEETMNCVDNSKQKSRFRGSFVCFLNLCSSCFGLFLFCRLTTCLQFLFFLFVSSLFALCAGDDVHCNIAIILATVCTCTVRAAERTAFTDRRTCLGKRQVTSAFTCFRAVYPHSYYHIRDTIPYLR